MDFCYNFYKYWLTFTVHKHGLSCGLVSVCLSRSYILSGQLKISSNFFCWPGSPIILVFWPSALIPNSKGTPSAEAQNTSGWENFAIFDWNCRLARKRHEIGPWLLWNINRKSYVLYWMVTFSMTSIDRWPWFSRLRYLSTLSISETRRDRAIFTNIERQ